MKIVTLKSIVLSEPVFDDKGKPLKETVKWNGRETTHTVHRHIQHSANVELDVEDALAVELVTAGHARDANAVIDQIPAQADADAIALN